MSGGPEVRGQGKLSLSGADVCEIRANTAPFVSDYVSFLSDDLCVLGQGFAHSVLPRRSVSHDLYITHCVKNTIDMNVYRDWIPECRICLTSFYGIPNPV